MWAQLRPHLPSMLVALQELTPYSTAPSLARRLQLYPSEEVLSAGSVLDNEVSLSMDLFSSRYAISLLVIRSILASRVSVL